VRRRLVADVPVGCFLSGGIDSSTVTALAAKHAGRERIKAFSIGFEEASFDETAFAREVAAHVNVDLRVETLPVQRALEILPDLAARMDEPIADSSILPTYLLCQHTRREVTVALGGDGADELLAGYDPFRALRYARRYEKWMPRPLHRAVSLLVARLPVSHRYMSLDFKLKRTLRGLDHPPQLWLPVWMTPLSPREMTELFSQPADLHDLYSEAIDAWESCEADNDVERTIAFYINTYLQNDILAKVDRASMLHSLEVRAPFLDIELVDFLRRLPADMKLRGGTAKWILRRAAGKLLPASIINRRKQGFALPVGGWLAEGKLGQPDTVSGERQTFWQQRLDEQQHHSADNRLYLWAEIALANPTTRHARTGSFRSMNTDQRTADAFATSWNNLPAGSVYTREQYADWMAPLSENDIRNRDVLELGCGNGSLLLHTADWRPRHLLGVDLGSSVETARANLQRAGFASADVQQADLTRFESSGFDVVYCIGVLHHLQDPQTGFSAVVRNVRPGGRFHCWVYAREGNGLVVALVEPIRKVASRLPWWFTKYAIATPLAIPFYLYAKALRRIIGTRADALRKAPLRDYCLWIAPREFSFFRHVAFDQLVTPQTTYLRRGQIERWLANGQTIDPTSTYIIFRNGNSWKFGGRTNPLASAAQPPAGPPDNERQTTHG
jgi:2-polyprenyl-3-methyl-5-hydroxy-6-metoxy-1,4-benzoquinol methylase